MALITVIEKLAIKRCNVVLIVGNYSRFFTKVQTILNKIWSNDDNGYSSG